MNTARTPMQINEDEISARIKVIDQNTIEYSKAGHGKITTSKPLNSVRLELALDESGLTQQELAELSKVKQPTISRIIEGKTKQSRYTPVIANALGISSDWLAGLDKNQENVKVHDNILRISGENFILIRMYERKDALSSSTTLAHKDNTRDSFVMIPERLIEPTINHHHLAFITVTESANSPDIRNGSAVTFNKNDKKIENGRFFVIKFGAMEECVRELYIEPNGDIRIKPRQEQFPEYIINHDDESFQILGRVVAVTNVY